MNLKTRVISDAEAGLVHWLLANATRVPAAEEYHQEVGALRVADACDCGCPSVDFLVEGLSATASILAEATGRSPEGVEVGVLLWTRGGRISGLEIYDLGDATSISLPRPADLTPATVISAN